MSPPRPWRLRAAGVEHDYRILRVREDQVEDPRNGALHPRVVIDASDWVNVLPITEDGQVVLVRQFRFGVRENSLELPGGIIETGESPLAAGLRELEEETGYTAANARELGWVHPNPAIQSNRCFCLLASGCRAVHAGKLDEGEDIEVVLVPRTKLPDLVRTGELRHALVLCNLLLSGL